MSSKRLVVVGLCLSLLTLATRVGSFDRVRRGVEIAQGDAAGSTWRAQLPGIGTADAPWRVIGIDLTNGPVAVVLEATAGETTTTEAIASGERRRLTVVARQSGPPAALQLRATPDHAIWQVNAVTLSNVHGFTRTLVGLTILPAPQPLPRPPIVLWLLSVAAAAWAWIAAGWPGPRRGAARSVAAAFATLFAVAILSPLISDYQLVVSPRTYALGLVLGAAAVAPRRMPWEAGLRRRIALIAAGLAGVAFFGSALVQQLADHGGNYSAFLHIPAERAVMAPFLRERPDLVQSLALGDESYDGQFMYLMAFDPFLARFADDPARYRDVVDFPPYRFGRIGYSWLTAAVALGRPERFPAVMMWLVVAGHLALGVALAFLARHAGAPPWSAALYLLVPGYMASLQFGLPESLASAGLVAGVYCWLTGRHLAAALSFAAALLIRETGVLLVVACIASLGTASWRARGFWLAGALLPMAAWRAYVAVVLWPDFGAAGLLPNPGILGWPFAGLVQLLDAAMRGAHPASEVRAALAIPVLLTAGGVLLLARRAAVPRGLAVAGFGYTLMALSFDYEHVWQHVPSGERASIEFFLSLLLVSILGHRAVAAGTGRWFWGFAALYTFLLSPESALSRAASGLLH
jgi:hypothetical protein